MRVFESRVRPIGVEHTIPMAEHPVIVEMSAWDEESEQTSWIVWRHDGFRTWEGVEVATRGDADEIVAAEVAFLKDRELEIANDG